MLLLKRRPLLKRGSSRGLVIKQSYLPTYLHTAYGQNCIPNLCRYTEFWLPKIPWDFPISLYNVTNIQNKTEILNKDLKIQSHSVWDPGFIVDPHIHHYESMYINSMQRQFSPTDKNAVYVGCIRV